MILFNYKYNCFVVVELKVTELKKEHIGQIQVYMNYIDETSLSKDSPLIMAAYSGSKSIMQKVIKNGADINYKNAEGATALMKVSNEGWTECAKLLVDAGADKNIKDNGETNGLKYKNITCYDCQK